MLTLGCWVCFHATAPFVCHVPVGCCEVPHNPEGATVSNHHHANGAGTARSTAITVPGNSFCPNGMGLVRSYVLLLRVTAGTQGNSNNNNNNDSDSGEPLSKKQRRNGCARPTSEESRHYVGEMVVYEQHRCLLSEGDYQLLLRPWGPKAAPLARTTSWETLAHSQVASLPLLVHF